MVYFTIDGKQYSVVTEWSELTLKKAIELYNVVLSFPESLRNYYTAFVPTETDTPETIEQRTLALESEFSAGQLLKEFPNYYGLALAAISDCPKRVIDKIMPVERNQFYQLYFKLVFGMFTGLHDYEPKGIDKFEFKGAEYYLPESREVLGQTQYMCNEIALTFTETADILVASSDMKEGKWDRAANILSILCRKKGEQYDENISLERAKEFLDITMDIVFEVFFCCMQPLIISKQQSQIYSLLLKAEKEKKMI
jgi:hypothetical protein